jgi:hypothetical protein
MAESKEPSSNKLALNKCSLSLAPSRDCRCNVFLGSAGKKKEQLVSTAHACYIKKALQNIPTATSQVSVHLNSELLPPKTE